MIGYVDWLNLLLAILLGYAYWYLAMLIGYPSWLYLVAFRVGLIFLAILVG